MVPLASAAVASGACEAGKVDSTIGRAPGGHVMGGSSVDADAVYAAEAQAAAAVDAGAEAACVRGTLPLLVKPLSDAPGAPAYKLYVPAKTNGQSDVFLVDTGSPFSFLHEPLRDGGNAMATDVEPDAGTAIVGCDLLMLQGAAVAQDPPYEGLSVGGTLGDEHLLARPLQLDFVSRQVIWHDPGSPFSGAATWPSMPYDRPGGFVRVRNVAFDGNPVQMFVDTGSADSVWLGQQGQPGDTEVDGEDSQGDTFKMYLGTTTLTIGSYQEKVPVFRVPSFPYLQQAVDALHGQLNGLIGLSSFARGIVFDTDTQVVRIAP
jgi:hypothetical protein